LAALFVAALAAGSLATAARMVADPGRGPALSLSRNLPARFETLFYDRLAGRDRLLAWHARLKVELLGASSTPRVRLGDQGWLYYHAEAERTYLKPGDPDLDRRLDRWAEAVPAWRDWLAARGARLLVVVAPDKQSVYPEHLPPVRRPHPGARPLDRVLAGWRADPALTVLDLRGPLCDAKRQEQVYFRTDTHWNAAGSFLAYTHTAAALARWFPGLGPRPRATFDWTTVREHAGDLPRLLALAHPAAEPFALPLPHIAPRARCTGEVVEVDESVRLHHLRAEVWAGGRADGPRALLFHDSFADGVFIANLAEHCARLVAVPSRQPDARVIGRERPDVVILELVERALQAETPRGPDQP
jgi:hypothetical protein